MASQLRRMNHGRYTPWQFPAVLAGATFATATTHTSSCKEDALPDGDSRVVPLAVTRREPSEGKDATPAMVFIHGLDSWRGTWRQPADALQQRGIRSLAVDLRGHGESPLGSAEDFGPRALAADVRAAVCRAGLLKGGARIVLVGHSMGGLVAMHYAAAYPQDLAALVIEDIDCVPWGDPLPTAEDLKRRREFNRQFSSWEACRQELVSFGYAEKRVNAWRLESPPRVFDRGDGGVWSAINPYAQHLATATVGNSAENWKAWQAVAAARICCGEDAFPVHLFVAGKHGCCSWDEIPGGVHDMASSLPGLQVRTFLDAFHSIHNTALAEFLDVVEIIARAC